jgi:hypothetical protein
MSGTNRVIGAGDESIAVALPAILAQALVKPIAVHRVFITIGGGIAAGLMLSHAWHRRNDRKTTPREPPAWTLKTTSDWEKETGLSRWEQEGARKSLQRLGLMKFELRGMPGALHYCLFEEKVVEAILAESSEDSLD